MKKIFNVILILTCIIILVTIGFVGQAIFNKEPIPYDPVMGWLWIISLIYIAQYGAVWGLEKIFNSK